MVDSVKKEFSERLVQAMRSCPQGTKSNTKHGVDTAGLKSAAGVTMEMARRYVEGGAMPRPEVMRAISEWLNVRVAWLRDGEGPMRISVGELPITAEKVGDDRGRYETASTRKLQKLADAAEKGEISEEQIDAIMTLLFGPARGRGQ
jgi:hypothetical protein